ncbi:MAG: FMN-binding negative transcriptional regulator [Bdellovibrionales bacterium]
MYLPPKFKNENRKQIQDLIRRHPFATVLTWGVGEEPFVNHLPLLVSDDGDFVVGHMSRRNPQWEQMRDGAKVKAIFHGPHAYITPTWYVSGRDVPTWNYAVVHVEGAVRLIESAEGLIDLLTRMTQAFENDRSKPWAFELPSDLKDPSSLEKAIVGFEIKISNVQAKFKLGQNRPDADREAVKRGLEAESSCTAKEMLRWL